MRGPSGLQEMQVASDGEEVRALWAACANGDPCDRAQGAIAREVPAVDAGVGELRGVRLETDLREGRQEKRRGLSVYTVYTPNAEYEDYGIIP